MRHSNIIHVFRVNWRLLLLLSIWILTGLLDLSVWLDLARHLAFLIGVIVVFIGRKGRREWHRIEWLTCSVGR